MRSQAEMVVFQVEWMSMKQGSQYAAKVVYFERHFGTRLIRLGKISAVLLLNILSRYE